MFFLPLRRERAREERESVCVGERATETRTPAPALRSPNLQTSSHACLISSMKSLMSLTLLLGKLPSLTAFTINRDYAHIIAPLCINKSLSLNNVFCSSFSSTQLSMSTTAAKRVLVPIADDSEEIETTCITDTLTRFGAEVVVASVKPDGELLCKMSRGVKVRQRGDIWNT
jgi:hypothetical protein